MAASTKILPTSRHLLWFSYIGTRFSGVQIQSQNITVQGVIHHALSALLRCPAHQIRMGVSSRTDAGVHAIMNTALAELPDKEDALLGLSLPYDGSKLTASLNKLLSDLDFEVRILDVRQVAPGFCARRHAYRRMYMYRLAVLKPEYNNLGESASNLAPLIEWNRSWQVESNFDPQIFKEACKMFMGETNVASFMTIEKSGVQRNPMRYLDLVDIDVGRCLLDPEFEPRASMFDFYEVKIVSRSFVYKQIRKMMSMLHGVAAGLASIKDLEWLLKNPNKNNYERHSFKLAPPGGLYMKQILYRESDFENPSPNYAHGWDEMPEDADEELLEEIDEEIQEEGHRIL